MQRLKSTFTLVLAYLMVGQGVVFQSGWVQTSLIVGLIALIITHATVSTSSYLNTRDQKVRTELYKKLTNDLKQISNG